MSVAFAGSLANGALCGQPRCLECVSADIAALGAGGALRHVSCRPCRNATNSYY